MSSVVATMHQVSLPRFTSASNTANIVSDDGKDKHNWASMLMGSADDQVDFDLLAEYLLDDGSTPDSFPSLGTGPSPDAEAEAPKANATNSEFYTAVDSQADPLADAHAQLAAGSKTTDEGQSADIASDLAQVQQMIAAHAARAQASVQTKAQQPEPQAQPQPPPQPQAAPAPAPLTHPGMGFQIPVTQTQTAPVSAPAPATLPAMVVHQHGAPATAPAPPPVSAPAIASTVVTAAAMSGSKRPLQFPVDVQGNRRQKTQAQISRRRERNRILARRTRLRKKFFFEHLQKDVTDLQRENNALKEIIKSKLDQSKAAKVLEECSVDLPSIVMESCGDATELDRQDFSLIKSLQGSQQCFVITDPSLQDNPIVYASGGFLGLTGYGRDEVLGRNCRFLQGTETSPSKIETIKKALEAGEDVSVCIINYTADGTAFWNQLFIAALRDANNNIVNFVGVLVKVSGPGPEDPEHGKLLPGTVVVSDDQEAPDASTEEGVQNSADAAEGAEGTVAAITDVVSAAVAAAPAF